MHVVRNYREFKAHNKYTYPFLFFTVGAVKNLGITTIIGALVYLGVSQLLKLNDSKAEVAQAATSPIMTSSKISKPLYDARWVFRQSEEKYTIQFASSPDKDLIYQRARTFPNADMVAVFPFKKNRNELFVYGVTAGLYDSVKSAQQAIANLPEEVRKSEPWIRSIGELQIQVAKSLDT